MFFYLSRDVLEHDVCGDGDVMCSVENVLSAYFDGSHLVCCDLGTVSELLDLDCLSGRSDAALKAIGNKYSELMALWNEFENKVVVTKSSEHVRCVDKVWYVPVTLFKKTVAVSPTVFVAENLSDCGVYEYSGDHYRVHSRFNGVCLTYTPRGGGGDTTCSNIKSIVDEKSSIVFSVLDSDKFSPKGKVGGTAKKCDELFKGDMGEWIYSVQLTEGRELENLIPARLLEESLDVASKTSFVSSLQGIGESIELYKYVDLKKGTLLSWVFSNKVTAVDRKFWVENLKVVAPRIKLDPECMGEEGCSNSGVDCECVVFGGLGDGLLEKVMKYLQENSKHKSVELVKEDESWMNIGRFVFEWCCAPARIRA